VTVFSGKVEILEGFPSKNGAVNKGKSEKT